MTRVEADDLEPLVASLVRKQLLTAREMRAALCEIEHLDITLAQAFDRLDLMDAAALDRLRARRTRELLEEIVTASGRATEFVDSEADGGPPISPVEAVIRGVVASGAPQAWLEDHREVEGSLRVTERFTVLREEVVKAGSEDLVTDSEVEPLSEVLTRLEDKEAEKLAALVLIGLLDLEEAASETPEGLEARAGALEATEEACQMLLQASELYAAKDMDAEARRAALSALRRRPTSAAPLTQVEQLCAEAGEVATLELVYELVNGAMPGPHGRRALLYRAGRVFEMEFIDTPRAREYYRRAVAQIPESGASLDALRRTSLAIGDTLAVADAFVAVALTNGNLALRQSWLEKALEIASRAGNATRVKSIKGKIRELDAQIEAAKEEDAPTMLEVELTEATAEASSQMGINTEPSDAFDWSSLDDAFTDDIAAETALPEKGPVDPTSQDSDFWGRTLLQPLEDEEPDIHVHPGLDDEELLLTPNANTRASAAKAAAPTVIEEDIDELCGALAATPGDLDRLRALMIGAAETIDEPVAQAATSLLALFDTDLPSCPLGDNQRLGALTDEQITALTEPPTSPENMALATLWRSASQLVTKDLADFGVGRAVPQKPNAVSPATDAFNEALRLLPSADPVRLLHMSAGPTAKVVLSRPLSLLTGPSGLLDAPDVRFRIIKAVASCYPTLVLPGLMAGDDLTILLQALHAAFGQSPPRGSLHFQAASLAQDLWTAVPRGAQRELSDHLVGASLPDVDTLRAEALAAAHRIALLITGDAAAAIRTAVADDPFLAGIDPTTEEGYARAIERSELVADLVRFALWPEYWQVRLGTAA